jgi:hypothetical protein
LSPPSARLIVCCLDPDTGANLDGGIRSHQAAGVNADGVQAAGAIAGGDRSLPRPGAKATGGQVLPRAEASAGGV